jgi:hypothetical protein
MRALLLLLLLPALALAQAPAPAPAQPKPARKRVIRLDAKTIEGRIQKPQAFYILQRSQLNFEELNRTDSFLPKVVKSVEKDPF